MRHHGKVDHAVLKHGDSDVILRTARCTDPPISTPLLQSPFSRSRPATPRRRMRAAELKTDP